MGRDEDRWGRRISDPRALRALAHPGRLAMLERLSVEGPATATECADVAGLSPSACSYHLRLLARYGFVEETADVAERSDGRERVWRATTRSWQSDLDPDEVPGREARAVDAALARVLLASSDDKALAWADASATQPRAWRDAALLSNSTILATAEEVREISERLLEVLSPYLARVRPAETAPQGARLVHAGLRLIPRDR